jgi:hypothetical protein
VSERVREASTQAHEGKGRGKGWREDRRVGERGREAVIVLCERVGRGVKQ